MNPIALEMMARAKQREINRQIAMQRRLDEADSEYRRWRLERSVLAGMSLMVPLSLLGIFFLM
jgi:hypothetical protein